MVANQISFHNLHMVDVRAAGGRICVAVRCDKEQRQLLSRQETQLLLFATTTATSANEGDASNQTPRTSISALLENVYKVGDAAPLCSTCGALTVRNGSCYKCVNCGGHQRLQLCSWGEQVRDMESACRLASKDNRVFRPQPQSRPDYDLTTSFTSQCLPLCREMN
jgi:predicted metal-binding protein